MGFNSGFKGLIYPLHVSNRVTIHHLEAFTVYAAYVIYHAEDICIICEKYTFLETSHKFQSYCNLQKKLSLRPSIRDRVCCA